MLVRFSVENFLSFKERTYFSMVAGKTRSKAYHKNKAISNVQTLKFSAVFGANASGKSNLIKSIHLGSALISLKNDCIPTKAKVQTFLRS